MRVICFLALWLASVVVLANESYQFDSLEQEQLYRDVISELRCPKCQNQSISDSDAELSEDLRFIVYQKLKAGDDKQAILDYMQKRYGDFVLYNPPVSPKNYLLWFMPVIVFILIISVLIKKVWRRELQPEDGQY